MIPVSRMISKREIDRVFIISVFIEPSKRNLIGAVVVAGYRIILGASLRFGRWAEIGRLEIGIRNANASTQVLKTDRIFIIGPRLKD